MKMAWCSPDTGREEGRGVGLKREHQEREGLALGSLSRNQNHIFSKAPFLQKCREDSENASYKQLFTLSKICL